MKDRTICPIVVAHLMEFTIICFLLDFVSFLFHAWREWKFLEDQHFIYGLATNN